MAAFNPHDFQRMIARALNLMPSHQENPKTIPELARAISGELAVSEEVASGIAVTLVAFLDLYGVLERSGEAFKLDGQIPFYLKNSLIWYLENNQQLFSNWTREGTSRDISISKLLDQAPYLLKIIEDKRVTLSREHNLKAGYSRLQNVSIVIIKSTIRGQPHVLHQWDTQAEQYQVIGGRQRKGEDPFETAKRELDEEITEHELVYDRDFDLAPITHDPLVHTEVSRSFGALTEYRFWFYHARFKLPKLNLSHNDLWISRDSMQKGRILSGKVIGDRYPILTAIPGGIESLADSVSPKTIDWSFIEFKPCLFGICIDIKAFLASLANFFGKNSS